MCTKQWNSSYNDLLQLCSLPALQQCRLYLDLCTMFKIVQGLFHFPTGIFAEQTSSHKVTVSPSLCPYAHTSSFYNSFLPRTIRNWNMFTAHVPLPTSVSSFNLIFGHTCEISYCTAILCAKVCLVIHD